MNDVLLKPAPGCFCGDCFSRKCDPPFKRWGLFWKVPLIHFDLNPEDPLTFCTSDTKEYIRPDRHMDSDGGSIPPPAQSLPFFDLSPFLYLWSYYNHDSAYRYGGWYTLRDGVWIFVLAPRDRVDEVCPLHAQLAATSE